MRAGPNFLWRSGDRLSGGLTAETGPSSRAPSSADFSSTYRTEDPAGFLMANLLSESQRSSHVRPELQNDLSCPGAGSGALRAPSFRFRIQDRRELVRDMVEKVSIIAYGGPGCCAGYASE